MIQPDRRTSPTLAMVPWPQPAALDPARLEALVAAAREELAGKDLACWCGLCELHQDGKPLLEDCPYCERCHVDTLGKIANGVLP